MAKLSKTPRKKNEDNITTSIFDALAGAVPQDGSTDKTGDTPNTEALLAQITALNVRQEALEQANRALMTAAPVDVVNLSAPPAIDMTGLPDPVTQGDQYAAELNKRIATNVAATVEYNQKKNSQGQDHTQRTNQLFSDFKSSNEAYADDQDKLEFATGKALDEAKKRGMDMQKYMFANKDAFFQDVVKHYDKTFGKPDTDDDGGLPDDESRTTSILGGQESGGKPSTPPPAPAGDMIKDIHEIQRKMGLF